VGLCAGVGLILGAHDLVRRRWRELGLSACATALALGAGELYARLLMPPPPGRPPIESARVMLPGVDLDDPAPANADYVFSYRQTIDACAYLHPDRYPRFLHERIDRPSAPRRVVLHLGDSLTFGQGVGRERAFPALLESRAPDTAHINAGLPMTSIDYHYLIEKHWLPLIHSPVELVVLNLYYNDALELDQPLACCDDQPPVDYRDSGVIDQCAEVHWAPDFGRSMSWSARSSPVPYPLRVATEWSVLARQVEGIFVNWSSRHFHAEAPRGRGSSDDQWGHFRLVLQAIRDDLQSRHIPLVAVLLPVRSSMESPDPAATPPYAIYAKMKELCDSLQITLLDPRPHFEPLIKQRGSRAYFLRDDDIHFNEAGHIEMANWLETALRPYLKP
jgi:lysophospholipase L1-like esterase